MRKIEIAIVLLVILAFASCSDSGSDTKKHNDLYFSNDFESARGWQKIYPIEKGDAHSGKYFSKTDKADPYSYTFNIGVGELSQKKIISADITMWVYVKDPVFKGSVVTSINQGDSAIFYNYTDILPSFKKTGEWFEVKSKVQFPATLAKDNMIVIYFWNIDGKSEIRIDDLEIQFYE